MEHKQFLELLKKYRRGEASVEEKKLIDAWYETIGERRDNIDNSRDEDLAESYWQSIQSEISKQKIFVPQHAAHYKITWKYAVGIAASLLVASIGFIYFFSVNIKSENLALTEDEILNVGKEDVIVNNSNVAMKHTLADGSNVTLKPHSSISVADHFNETTREIHLDGEAFFEIAHNKERPFFVHANGIITKVLGTSFTVKAFKSDNDVIVSVNSGKVSVYNEKPDKTNKKAEVILTPNQQIVYDKNRETISRKIVEAPQPIVNEKEMKRTLFKAAPVNEIFAAIEDIYGIEIEVDEALSSCKLTTSISDGDLYNRLSIITNAIGATYTINENRIVITGGGCN